MKSVSRTSQVQVHVPARGEEGGASYPGLWELENTRPSQPYAPARLAMVEILDVPLEITDDGARQVLEAILQNGGGFPASVRWSFVLGQLTRLRLEIRPTAKRGG